MLACLAVCRASGDVHSDGAARAACRRTKTGGAMPSPMTLRRGFQGTETGGARKNYAQCAAKLAFFSQKVVTFAENIRSMTKETLKIVFMGTPDFAVESLKALVEGGYNVVGVVTMPDKPVGRHQTSLAASAVKQYALEQGLPVLQPERLRDEEFLQALRAWNADLQIVVAFRMLPEVVWDMPPYGTFNLHAALLPQYRGAAPINWAIINGETQTGITTFFLDHDIDTGRIIRRVAIDISDTDNAEDVHDKLMVLGAKLVAETVDAIIADEVVTTAQEELAENTVLHPAPKIFKETCRIDWTLPTKRVYDFIRGLSPYPAAWTELVCGGKRQVLKVYATEKDFSQTDVPAGTVVIEGKKTLKVALSDGWLHIKSLQLSGKKRMDVSDFLRGFHADEELRVE